MSQSVGVSPTAYWCKVHTPRGGTSIVAVYAVPSTQVVTRDSRISRYQQVLKGLKREHGPA